MSNNLPAIVFVPVRSFSVDRILAEGRQRDATFLEAWIELPLGPYMRDTQFCGSFEVSMSEMPVDDISVVSEANLQRNRNGDFACGPKCRGEAHAFEISTKDTDQTT